MKITGVLIFFLMACFDKIGRGGLRPFFDWISENSEACSIWRTKLSVSITPGLLIGIDFFLYVIPLIKPKIYRLGIVHPPSVVAYSDAEWTALHPNLLPSRGLGGCVFQEPDYRAYSLNTPMQILFGLAPRHTQIIPLELIAAIGLVYTFQAHLHNTNLIFFIDNQSVCAALTKGSSHSRDIQHLATGFHAFCAKIGCKVWIEWVPSNSNPADALSRVHESEEYILRLYKDAYKSYTAMRLPPWVDQQAFDRFDKILDCVKSDPFPPLCVGRRV